MKGKEINFEELSKIPGIAFNSEKYPNINISNNKKTIGLDTKNPQLSVR